MFKLNMVLLTLNGSATRLCSILRNDFRETIERTVSIPPQTKHCVLTNFFLIFFLSVCVFECKAGEKKVQQTKNPNTNKAHNLSSFLS